MQPHELLGVRPGAGRDELAAAFRRFARAHHPDRGGDPARFRAGVEAYRRLAGRAPATTGQHTAGQHTAGQHTAGHTTTAAFTVDVVFHRRRRGVAGLVARARRRLARFRP